MGFMIHSGASLNLKELARQKGRRREKLSKLESRLGRERASGGVTFGTSVSLHFTMNVYRVGGGPRPIGDDVKGKAR